MATMVNIHEAKTHLSKLVERVANGEEIIIAKAGKPMARLSVFREEPEQRPAGRGFGCARSLFSDAEIEALLDPALDREIADMFLEGPLFPDE